MEQKTSVDTSSKKLDDSNNSLPQKRAKRQPEEKSPPSHTTSNDASTTAGNLNRANHLYHQLPRKVKITENQQPYHTVHYIFSLRRKIMFRPLRRILVQTQPVWRARELEEFGTSL